MYVRTVCMLQSSKLFCCWVFSDPLVRCLSPSRTFYRSIPYVRNLQPVLGMQIQHEGLDNKLGPPMFVCCFYFWLLLFVVTNNSFTTLSCYRLAEFITFPRQLWVVCLTLVVTASSDKREPRQRSLNFILTSSSTVFDGVYTVQQNSWICWRDKLHDQDYTYTGM